MQLWHTGSVRSSCLPHSSRIGFGIRQERGDWLIDAIGTDSPEHSTRRALDSAVSFHPSEVLQGFPSSAICLWTPCAKPRIATALIKIECPMSRIAYPCGFDSSQSCLLPFNQRWNRT